MFKKNRTLILIVVLVVLTGAFLLFKYMDKSDRSFKETITDFSPEAVTNVYIKSPSKMTEIELQKQNNDWRVIIDKESYPADTLAIQNLITAVSNLKTKRFAAKDEKAWAKYEVTDSAATRAMVNQVVLPYSRQ